MASSLAFCSHLNCCKLIIHHPVKLQAGITVNLLTCQNCSLDPQSTFPKVAIVGVGTQHPFFTMKENSEEFVAKDPLQLRVM